MSQGNILFGLIYTLWQSNDQGWYWHSIIGNLKSVMLIISTFIVSDKLLGSATVQENHVCKGM
jgi:hypothetical protein